MSTDSRNAPGRGLQPQPDPAECTTSRKHSHRDSETKLSPIPTTSKSNSQERCNVSIYNQPRKRLRRTTRIETQDYQELVPSEPIPATSGQVQWQSATYSNLDMLRELNTVAEDCNRNDCNKDISRQAEAKRIIYKLYPKLNEIYRLYYIEDKSLISAMFRYAFVNISQKLKKGPFNLDSDCQRVFIGLDFILNEWGSSSETEEETDDNMSTTSRGSSSELQTEYVPQTMKDSQTNIPVTDVNSLPSCATRIKDVFNDEESSNDSQDSPIVIQSPTKDTDSQKLTEITIKLESQVQKMMQLENISGAELMQLLFSPKVFTNMGNPQIPDQASSQDTNLSPINGAVTPNEKSSSSGKIIIHHQHHVRVSTTPCDGMRTRGYQHCVKVFDDDNLYRTVGQIYLDLQPNLETFYIEYNIVSDKLQKLIRQYTCLRIMQCIKFKVELEELKSRYMRPSFE